jgi:hypothetical protein
MAIWHGIPHDSIAISGFDANRSEQSIKGLAGAIKKHGENGLNKGPTLLIRSSSPVQNGVRLKRC